MNIYFTTLVVVIALVLIVIGVLTLGVVLILSTIAGWIGHVFTTIIGEVKEANSHHA